MFNKVAYLSLKGGLPSGDTSLHLGELLNRADFLLYSLIPDPHRIMLLQIVITREGVKFFIRVMKDIFKVESSEMITNKLAVS